MNATTTGQLPINEKSPATGKQPGRGQDRDSLESGNQQVVNHVILAAHVATTGSEISAVESARLAELEIIVDEGRKTFLTVGSALLEIQEGRLYRSSHGTFDAYCQERFGFKSRNAYQLIGAAKVMGNLSTVRNCAQIETESQAREVGKAPAERQAEVMQRATELAEHRGSKLTAAVIAEARAEIVQGVPFKVAIDGLEDGVGWLQMIDRTDEQIDITLVVRTGSTYCVCRMIDDEPAILPCESVEGVILAIEATDDPDDWLPLAIPFEFIRWRSPERSTWTSEVISRPSQQRRRPLGQLSRRHCWCLPFEIE